MRNYWLDKASLEVWDFDTWISKIQDEYKVEISEIKIMEVSPRKFGANYVCSPEVQSVFETAKGYNENI